MFGSFPHYKNPYWTEDGAFAMTYQDAHIDQLLEWNPRACFLPRIFASAPDWWIAANPDEQIRYGSGAHTTPRESFASEKCLRESGEMYRHAVRHLLDKYSENLLGIHVTNGPWGENFSWDAYFFLKERPAASDVSEPMRQAFIRYLRKKYHDDTAQLRAAFHDENLHFEEVQVPGKAERLELSDGAWRDPGRSRRVPDYFECHNETTVRMLDHYCRIVKEESGNRLTTLVFYGYTQDEKWPTECDHRAVSELYRLESVDMLSAPHTYHRRRPGEDGEMRQYLASAALHGKFFFDEGDDQTYLELQKPNPDSRAHAENREQSISLIYREFGNTVTHSTGLWYMDLNGGWFRDPALADAVGRMKKWSEESLNHSRRRVSEVAIISNPQSEYYLGYRLTPANNISTGLYLHQMGEFYRAGAPFDWFLIDDLAAVEVGGYKVCIFLDCFFMTEEHRAIVERMKSANRTLVWFYAPGYVCERELSLDGMEALTGFRFQKMPEGPLLAKNVRTGKISGVDEPQKALFVVTPEEDTSIIAEGTGELAGKIVQCERSMDGWKSVFSAVPGLGNEDLRRIYREAGVHVYTDSDVVLSAIESWLMLHTRVAGTYRVVLPRVCRKVTEITSERVVGENVSEFSIPLPKFSTAIFLME